MNIHNTVGHLVAPLWVAAVASPLASVTATVFHNGTMIRAGISITNPFGSHVRLDKPQLSCRLALDSR
jgi:hypothetical protein